MASAVKRMAEGDEKEIGYWQTLCLTYADGFKLTARFDLPTIQMINGGDAQLLERIRENYLKAQIGTAEEAACLEAKKVPMEATESNCCLDEEANNFTQESDSTDVEDVSLMGSQYFSWPRAAAELLISLYKENETDLENPTLKKKDVWEKITSKMNKNGYQFSQNKVESKWRSLMKSHKDVKMNKSQTGTKRKSFQFFEEIDEIVSKRHDINPPVVLGTGTSLPINKTTTFHVKEKTEDSKKKKMADQGMVGKKKHKKIHLEQCTVASETLEFLKLIEEKRQTEYEERERNRDRRANERNDILKSFLECLKKDQ